MAYITVAELQSEFKGLTFSASTNPTSTIIETMIDEESNFIDAALNNHTSVPVSLTNSPKFYSIVQRICKKIVKHRVNQILKISTGSNLDSESPENLENKARKELRELIDRKEFYDATRNASNSYGFSDNNYSNDIEPVFKIDNDQSLGSKNYW